MVAEGPARWLSKIFNSIRFTLTKQIRKATDTEAGLIASLSQKTFYDTFAPSNTKEDMDLFLKEQFTIPNLEAEVLEGKGQFYLMQDGDKVLGYVRLGRTATFEPGIDSIEIVRFYMTTEAIGTGAASILMNFCLDLARENSYKKVALSVWKENHRAIAFYKKFGFEITGETEFLLGKDLQFDHVMEKVL